MALGTMTLVSSVQAQPGGIFIDRVTLVGDGAYPTGGSAGVKTALQALTKDKRTPFLIVAEDRQSVMVDYDVANDKLKTFTAVGTETTNATDQSAKTFKLTILSA